MTLEELIRIGWDEYDRLTEEVRGKIIIPEAQRIILNFVQQNIYTNLSEGEIRQNFQELFANAVK